MVELQKNTEANLRNVGFTYPEDVDSDSMEQLKRHDVRLTQTKEILLAQQTKLKKILQNLKRCKKGKTTFSLFFACDNKLSKYFFFRQRLQGLQEKRHKESQSSGHANWLWRQQ